jgi:hypothetical protein
VCRVGVATVYTPAAPARRLPQGRKSRNAQQKVNAVEKPLPGRGRPSITSSHQGNLLCLIAVLQQSNQKRGATPATRRQPPMPPPPRPLFGAFSIGNLGRRI